jgi:hypothetical protein
MWSERAARFKSQGRLEVTLTMISEPSVPRDLEDVLRKDSVLIVVPTGTAVPDIRNESITTWRSFRLLEVLSARVPASPSACLAQEEPRLPTAIQGSELVVPFTGGTVTVDGVTFTMSDLHWPRSFRLEEGQRYLMLATRCQSGRTQLAYGRRSLYAVTPEGTISASEGQLANELLQIGTIQRLKERLAAHGQ